MAGYNNMRSKTTNPFDDEEDSLEQLVARREASERAQLASLQRSIGVVDETEEIGIKTSEELVRQGEGLDRTEEALDSISAMTKVTQRQLNNIKSVFGGIKNWFQKSEATPRKTEIQHSKLKEVVSSYDKKPEYTKSKTSHPHKASRLYNENSDDDENDDQFRTTKSSASNKEAFDEQLAILSGGLGRLKKMGEGMNEELIRQNEQLDRLQHKVEENDDVIKSQTRQTRKMLS